MTSRFMLLAVLAVAACGDQARPAPDRSGPIRQVAREYFKSLLAHDDARTCELLGPSARYGVLLGADSCADAIAGRMDGKPVPALVRTRFEPEIVGVTIDGDHARVKVRHNALTTWNPELQMLREEGRWKVDDDEPADPFSQVGACTRGYADDVTSDPEWRSWSDRSRAEYTVRFCRLLDERGLMGFDSGIRVAHVEDEVVNQLYDEGLMTLR